MTENKTAQPRVTIKEGHILEDPLTTGEYFGRSSDPSCDSPPARSADTREAHFTGD